MITLESVTKAYPDGTIAVDNLSIEAPTGQITVLVGPSGCGKTTSLRMVNRMIEPTSGRILINGDDTARLRPAELRRGIGYVIQHAGLFPHRTVLANVMTVPHLLGWSKARAQVRAMEVLELVGLPPGDYAKRYPAQLSGGQQQRVGVARALAADPAVMLMDEPFSAVDPVVRAGLQDEFRRLQRDLGTTIVFVTHDIDEAIKLGDQVAVLRQGGVLAQFSSPAELLAGPADDFVADFVGRDRGYRALSFVTADCPVHPEQPVQLGSVPSVAASDGSGPAWQLAVDDADRPVGWVRGDQVGGPGGVVTHADLHLGGTLARSDGPLRALLDAALSSPSGRGVVVDHDGRLVGSVLPEEVMDVVRATHTAAQTTSRPGAEQTSAPRTPDTTEQALAPEQT